MQMMKHICSYTKYKCVRSYTIIKFTFAFLYNKYAVTYLEFDKLQLMNINRNLNSYFDEFFFCHTISRDKRALKGFSYACNMKTIES